MRYLKKKLTNIEGNKLQLILLNKSVEAEILKTTPKRLIISSSTYQTKDLPTALLKAAPQLLKINFLNYQCWY